MSNEAGSSGGGGESVVSDVGRWRSTCGYCKSGHRSSVSHGLSANSLTIVDYQDLLDRGWRRSGCFLYKPEMETTCCPAYTIRLRADDFSPTKEQLRVSRRMQRYLDGQWDGKKQELPNEPDYSQECPGEELQSSKFDNLETVKQKSKDEEILDYLSEYIDLAIQSLVKSGDLPGDIEYPKCLVKEVSETKKRRIVEGSEDLKYTSNVAFQIAATLRRSKADGNGSHLLGSKERGSSEIGLLSDSSPKSIAEELVRVLQHLVEAPELSVKACNGHINFYSPVKEDPSVKESDQNALPCESSTPHKVRRLDMIPDKPQSKKRKLEILLYRSGFDPEEFALYRRYQTKVHNDKPEDVTESSYKRFLVDTPLIFVPPAGDDTVPPCGFGSFHQQYRIDGHLIAVGVIDILPKCLSSKYLFWDPDFAFLSLGKYSALQEISWVKENQRRCSSLLYYYLGYYIHSCPKMRYKAAYHPSELLCPLRYKWVPYDIAKPLLDRTKFAVLSDYANTQNGALSRVQQHDDLGDEDSNDTDVREDEEMLYHNSESSDDELSPYPASRAAVPPENADVGDLLVGLIETRMRYKDLRRALDPTVQSQLENQLLSYKKVVGQQLSERMVYSLA